MDLIGFQIVEAHKGPSDYEQSHTTASHESCRQVNHGHAIGRCRLSIVAIPVFRMWGPHSCLVGCE